VNQRPIPRPARPQRPLLLQAATERHRQGKLDEAEQLYKALLVAQPQNGEAMRAYGRLLLQRGRNADALQWFDAATRAAPKDAGAWCELGTAHAAVGRLQEAVASYDRALSLDGRHVGALTNKGNALVGLGRRPEALASYDLALAVQPRLAAALSNRGGLLCELGRFADALISLNQALAVAPSSADALSNRGNALLALDRVTEALASYDRALDASPNFAGAHGNRGNALLKMRRPQEALASYDRALAIAPASPDMLTNRGNALRALKRHAEAIDCFAKALSLAPRRAPTLSSLADTLLELGRPFEALACYGHALACDPDYVEALANRASALLGLKRPAEALSSAEKALTRVPRHVEALNNRAAALTALGREAEALASCDNAIEARPDFALAHDNKGVALLHLGRLAEASAAFEAAIALDPSLAHAHYHLALTRRFAPSDPRFAGLEALIQQDKQSEDRDRIFAHFALGKAFADVGDADRSFAHLASGNAANRRLVAYDEAVVLGALQRTGHIYDEGLFKRLTDCGANSRAPLFVIGMPRSGTTLVEQILASHPQVHGAGEINDFELAALEIGGATGEAPSTPEAVLRMRADDFHRLGASYLERIAGRAAGALFIVNKMTENFRHAGLIALALPNARILHVRRNPLDVCVSCFAQLFFDNLPFTYDLAELGRYYRGYDTLMAHWRRMLPKGMMIDVVYEELVANLEGEGRRIVEHCGLEWDPRCLDFHMSQRSIRTASVAQVRQPLYDSSVGKWRRYEPFLAPLIEALGPSAGLPRSAPLADTTTRAA